MQPRQGFPRDHMKLLDVLSWQGVGLGVGGDAQSRATQSFNSDIIALLLVGSITVLSFLRNLLGFLVMYLTNK